MIAKDKRARWDGINNLKYRLQSTQADLLFTKISVDFRRFIVQSINVTIDGRDRIRIVPDSTGKCDYIGQGSSCLTGLSVFLYFN